MHHVYKRRVANVFSQPTATGWWQ